jgi:glucose-6-phosphate 1-epimerase
MDNDAGVSVRLSTFFVFLCATPAPNQAQHPALQPRPSISAVYDKAFELAYVVTLAEHQLSTDLHITNPSSSDTLEFQALLHTYIYAPAHDVTITPLIGKRYVDKVDGAAIKNETRPAVDVRQFTDAVYEDAPDTITVSWPNGGLVVKKKNFSTVTIWNPAEVAGSKIGDMEAGGWYVSSFC